MPLEPQAAVLQRCPKCGAALEVSSNMWGPFLRCDDCGHACDDYPDATVHVRGDRRSVAIQRANVRLAAVLMLPSGQPPYPCVIFVHGLGSGKDSPRNVVVASRIVDSGMAALLFDLSGHGESDTDPRPGEEPYIEDLAAAFHWAARELEIDSERIGVAGSSLGAVVALSAIRRLLVRPAALVLRAPPIEPGDLDDIAVPMLVVIGTQDPLIARVRMAAAWTRWATLSIVDGAGHLFEEPGALEEAVDRTADFFSRRLLPKRQCRGPG